MISAVMFMQLMFDASWLMCGSSDVIVGGFYEWSAMGHFWCNSFIEICKCKTAEGTRLEDLCAPYNLNLHTLRQHNFIH